MSTKGSVTQLIDGLRTKEQEAVRQLWEKYFHRLVQLARKQLGGAPRRGADEEDVALSAFDSFCRGAGQGRYPRLDDRDDLWQVLRVITQRKTIDLIQYECREKRDCRKTEAADADGIPFADVCGHEPDPAFAAQFAEECKRLLGVLPPDWRQVAVLKMEGHTNEDIKELLHCSVATVERRLALIRDRWKEVAKKGQAV